MQLDKVSIFHRAITGLPFAKQPTLLAGERLEKGIAHLSEELIEFEDAVTIEDQADALVDLIYVAAGRLHEMGIEPGPAFELVHAANMNRVPGVNRRGSEYEAVKPAGWQAPNWTKHLNLLQDDDYSQGHYVGLSRKNNPWDGVETVKPKILLLGYGRHGKDTVAEYLRDHYGYKFTSSSMACAEKVMLPAFRDIDDELGHGWKYQTAEECFNDRHNHRAFWFQEIERFNTPDKAALGKMIFESNDIYVGLRSKREYAAVKNAGLFDVAIWVDASDRLPPEDKASCTVEPWMAELIIDNNGTLEELHFGINQLMENLS